MNRFYVMGGVLAVVLGIGVFAMLRTGGGRGAAAGPQHRKHADAQHHGQDTPHYIESIHPSVSPRQGSSSSGSSSDRSPPPMASSTIRRLSATSGVSYVLRTS